MEIYWIAIVTAIAILLIYFTNENNGGSAIENNLSRISENYDPSVRLKYLFDKIYLISIPERRESASHRNHSQLPDGVPATAGQPVAAV